VIKTNSTYHLDQRPLPANCNIDLCKNTIAMIMKYISACGGKEVYFLQSCGCLVELPLSLIIDLLLLDAAWVQGGVTPSIFPIPSANGRI
jgi:hypothetical protein